MKNGGKNKSVAFIILVSVVKIVVNKSERSHFPYIQPLYLVVFCTILAANNWVATIVTHFRISDPASYLLSIYYVAVCFTDEPIAKGVPGVR